MTGSRLAAQRPWPPLRHASGVSRVPGPSARNQFLPLPGFLLIRMRSGFPAGKSEGGDDLAAKGP